jgi:hypothetical protein
VHYTNWYTKSWREHLPVALETEISLWLQRIQPSDCLPARRTPVREPQTKTAPPLD